MPRSGSGGSKQKFCSDTCRKLYHKGDAGDAGNNQCAETQLSATPDNTADDDKPERFTTLLAHRPAILAEIDANGDLIIVQWPGDERGEVRIAADDIDAFVDRLTDLLGYRSAP
jgi:hypothetical protein